MFLGKSLVYDLYIDCRQRKDELSLYSLFVTQEFIVTFS